MTSPTPGAPSGSSTPGAPVASQLPIETVSALGAALNAENAALWAYGPIAARLVGKDAIDALDSILSGHLQRRDSTMALIQAVGGKPDPPAPAYQLPAIKDAATARKAAYLVEDSCIKAWRAVVGLTDIADLRGLAVAGMADSAVWTTTIKLAVKDPKPTDALPGIDQ